MGTWTLRTVTFRESTRVPPARSQARYQVCWKVLCVQWVPLCWLRKRDLRGQLGSADFCRIRAASMLSFINCPSGSPSSRPATIERARLERRR